MMSGISATLSIAKTALAAQQYGLSVTGNNIANVNNPDYSRQDADQVNATSISYAGYLFGTGVDISQVRQTVDQLLENRLTDEISSQAAMEEAESYMSILEGIFDENSESSLSSLLSEYWNSWQDLSNNPLGTSERVQVYEQGVNLAERFNSIIFDLDQVSRDLTHEMDGTVSSINSLTAQIAVLNGEILGLESNKTANDLRDMRNALIDDLGELINIDVITEGDGSCIINAANGSTLVNGVDRYTLAMKDKQVLWQGSSGTSYDITDDITGGKLAGWLEIRDEVIPKYQSQVNELSGEMIWAINYQHSQGAGLSYFSGPTLGTCAADDSGWLSSFDFGDRIEYSNDFSMWIEDTSSAETRYHQVLMDMGISQASISGWQGTAPGADLVSYRLTVMDDAVIGDKIVTQTNGGRLGQIWSSAAGGVATALDNILSGQTLTITGSPTGTHTIEIGDSGADAQRSAASIAEELNQIEGVSAYASKTQVAFGLGGISNAEDGDIIQYSLYVDGGIFQQQFTVDSSTNLDIQFEDSLIQAAKDINILNGDTDLYADGLVLSSDKGATLGIQDFEVTDNAGIILSNFANFNTTDTVSLTLSTDGVPTTSTTVSVDLTRVSDITDQAEMSSVFYEALSAALSGRPFSVERDAVTDAVYIRTTDGSNVTLGAATGDTGDDATITLSALLGTAASGIGNTSVEFLAGGTDVEIFQSVTLGTDTMAFSMPGTVSSAVNGATSTINETGSSAGTATTAAAIVGTVTAYLEPGMSIISDNRSATGLFGTAGTAATGSAILTLGGNGGFGSFDAGDTISFDVDDNTVSFTVTSAAGGTTDAGLALQLFNQLNSDIPGTDYQFVLNGTCVSIIKNADLEDPIEISNFTDNTTNDAVLSLSTGTCKGINDPDNNLLESGNNYRNFSFSSPYGDDGIIRWEKLDTDGNFTGESGLLAIEDTGRVTIAENGVETLSFTLSAGTLVAGNTLTIHTDSAGQPDPLDFDIYRQANSVNDTYHFEVISGGSVGVLPGDDEETLTISWYSSVSSGTFEIQGSDPRKTPESPVQVAVDGMLLNFYGGTLFKGDVFTIPTDESGLPSSTDASGKGTGELMSDWHWTLDSFVDEFNRNGAGMKATATVDNQLLFDADDTFFTIQNIEYSGTNGFCEENASITVLDYTALDFNALDMQFVRSSGNWGILNDATGGTARIIPDGGDDDGFKVDLDGDGLGDIEISFAKAVFGDGSVRFDLLRKDSSDIKYAFGDTDTEDCGLIAAAGINTFFRGDDANTMQINEKISDVQYIAAGKIDADTGEITQGDNLNALAVADVQYMTLTMKQWEFVRGEEANSSLLDASLDDYYNAMIGSLGVKSQGIKSSREFADIMVSQLTEQRDAVSAVSLDEEMIKLMKYQQAYTAASKLLTVADEMLSTLLSIR